MSETQQCSDEVPDYGLVRCYPDDRLHPVAECVETDNGWCLRSNTVVTYDGRTRHRDTVVPMPENQFARDDDDSVMECADGLWRLEDDCVEVDGLWYHWSQAFECTSCGYNHLVSSRRTVRARQYCEACYDELFHDCDSCGGRMARIDGDTCQACQESGGCAVLCYSNREANHLRPRHRGPELLGIELEVEPSGASGRSEALEAVRHHLPEDYCVFKEDGSLGPGGFEIVTRPDSMEVHREMFSKLLDSPQRRYIRSWDTGRCGMHVHVNRGWLTNLQLGKMLVFVNSRANQSFVSMIAGRTSSTWARFKDKKISDVTKYEERYVALNIGPTTAEFRIFRGNVVTAGFVKNLEFVRALVEFTAPAGRSIREATDHKAFVRWVCPKAYPTLYDFLAHKGLRPARKKKPDTENGGTK